jgi:threonine dehydratase
MLDFVKSINDAYEKLSHYLKATPLLYSHSLSLATKAAVYLKLENTQPTGSFKVRGAFNKILSLAKSQQNAGVVAASTGNHGAAVAYACQRLNIKAEVFVPENAAAIKVNNIKSYAANIHFFGNDCGETEKHAREYAKQHDQIYISPYNDLDVIVGQGTMIHEVFQQIDKFDAVFAPVGGGGLISGIGGYIKSLYKKIQVLGCLPLNSPVMLECIKANRIITIDTQTTLSDATAGNMDLDSITFDYNKQFVDEWLLASEAEIASAMRYMLENEQMVVEGAVGVTIAALLQQRARFENKTLVVIISGRNVTDNIKE